MEGVKSWFQTLAIFTSLTMTGSNVRYIIAVNESLFGLRSVEIDKKGKRKKVKNAI